MAAGNWTIFQKFLDVRSEVGGFDCDGNVINPSFESFGQFGAGEDSLDTARRGIGCALRGDCPVRPQPRSGPGENFRVLQTLDTGTIVTGVGRDGSWTKVDLEGDGQADGFVFTNFLQAVSGGLPAPLPMAPSAFHRGAAIWRYHGDAAAYRYRAAGTGPVDVAEIPGREDNPRIVMYHRTTEGGGGTRRDGVVLLLRQLLRRADRPAGHQTARRPGPGTIQDWGRDVTFRPVEGDIVVFSRHSPTEDGGHVGFFIADEDDQIRILGGNQGNRIGIRLFPKDGSLGSMDYKLAVDQAEARPGPLDSDCG